MNQILVSQKLYVTPDMKKKKKAFKFEFFLSVFLLCILTSYAIYAEYDRSKNEQVSKDLLDKISYEQKSLLSKFNKSKDDSIIIVLNEEEGEDEELTVSALLEEEDEIEVPEEQILVAADGTKYYTIGEINIPSIDVNYPILTAKDSDNLETILRISVCKFHGANPNKVGNLCIVGHNYRNSLFFSKVPKLDIGDIIEISDLSGKTLQYSIYDKYVVEPSNVECTSQLTDGKREVTLITCTNDSKKRHILKAREVE